MLQNLYFVFLLISILISKNAFSQENKRNNVWTIGYEPVVKFHFNGFLFIDTVQNVNQPVAPGCVVLSGACIGDTNGTLKLFTNGFIAYDSNGFGIQNGTYINCPKGNLLADHYGGSSVFDQTSIILPKKGNRYYVFSTGMSDSVAANYINHVYTEFDVLNYSIVDMDSNVGKGKVIEKNTILADDRHYVNCALTAVRHGNGKDWWLVKADCMNNRYEEYIVKEDTIEGPYFQNMSSHGDFCVFNSQIYFNEEGTKFASSIYGNIIYSAIDTTYEFNRVDLYDFDRCSGSIVYKNYYQVPFDTSSFPNVDYKAGISFSPNGTLLYMSNFYTIYQIDLDDTNRNNATFITGPDTSINVFPWYHSMKIAPNGKIYIGTYGGSPYMSYIDSPNVKGLGCHFTPHGLWQPYTYLLDPPNMPNYGLGWNGLCSPLSNAEVERDKESFVVYPVPTNQNINIEYSLSENENADFVVYDMLGNEVERTKLYGSVHKAVLDLHHLSRGVYTYKASSSNHHYAGKIIIQ